MIIRQLKPTEFPSMCCMCYTRAMAVLEYTVKYPITHLPDDIKHDPVCIQHAKEQLDSWLESL